MYFCAVGHIMLKAFRHIIFISIFLAFSAGMSAQDLPSLKRRSGITTGRFDNGISYYLVPNTYSKGYANFALIQKGVENQEDTRASLDYDFLASKGVGYTPDGYISWSGDAAVFNFEDVPTFQSVALDSTIIMLFNLIGKFPGEQAIVASGDLDIDRLKDRLYIMSLTISKRAQADSAPEYEWKGTASPVFEKEENGCRNLAEISISYASSRTPRKYMNTPQPLVTSMFARQLGYILRKRIEELFAEKDIPLGYVQFKHVDSASTASDEVFELVTGVAGDDVKTATELIAGVLADIDRNGVSPDEFADAKARFQMWAERMADAPVTNKDFVSSCVANYIYGAGMFSPKDLTGFFSGRKIPMEQDRAMFNRFIAALLDPEKNLTVKYSMPSDSLDLMAMQRSFREAWKASPEPTAYHVKSNDTLSLYYPVEKKMKIKSDGTDPQTDGTVWTFANGMKVVFRKTDENQIRYAMLIRGGYTEVPGIKEGESAFVGDMLGLYDVCGMSPMRFRNMLEANGITMNCEVTIADMCIRGTAPVDKMSLLCRSLLSVHKNRSLNKDAFSYYKRCEALRQEAFRKSVDGINAVTDSIMCPDFFFPSTKTVEKLGDDLPDNAEAYFAAQFSKCQDGVIFIEGNLNSGSLQKILVKSIGAFRASRSFSVRPKVKYQLRSGWSTYTVNKDDRVIGEGESANLALAAERPFTMQNWCAFRIAVEYLRRELIRDMAPLGQYFEISPQLQLLPVERIAVFVNCIPCPSEGLPAGVEPANPMEVMSRLRDALVRISESSLSAETLKGLRDALAKEMAGEAADPDYVMEAFLLRNSEGKDVLSNYSTYLSKVTAEDVMGVISALEKGSKVEFIIK